MYRAIVVDDEPLAREGMRILVNWGSAGFQLVGEASDAAEAIRLIEEQHPHLVFLDVQMPGMDGRGLAQRIYAEHSDILIAFLSGHSIFDYAQAAISVQALCYLLKPIDSEEIERELRAAGAMLKARERQSQDAPAPQMPEHRMLGAMHEYIEAEFSHQLTVAALAGMLDLHPGYLGQQIKRLSGASFLQHLTAVRLERAALLLQTTDRSVKDIAISVGIPNVDYFSQQFRRTHGMTPGDYRRQKGG